MKKFKTMMAMMLALVSMCVAFSSCSSDDDDTVAAAKEIADWCRSLTLRGISLPDQIKDETFMLMEG